MKKWGKIGSNRFCTYSKHIKTPSAVLTRHVNNIINEGELPVSVCAENALTASDGKVYLVKYYNLDMIIAVEYRVNSKRGLYLESGLIQF